MMNRREENSDSIPIDLISEILWRLPTKSIARFCCVSKLWGSMLQRPHFRDLFLTRSRAHPRIVFVLHTSSGWSLYSLPQLQNPVFKKSSSRIVVADFQIKFTQRNSFSNTFLRFPCSYASGLICFSDRGETKTENRPVIINPSTGQYVIIPKLIRSGILSQFLGFDPIDKQFKLLSMGHPHSNDRDEHRILILGTGELMWRKIQSPLTHRPYCGRKATCINGVLYYQACEASDYKSTMIVCFDVRSEKFKFIHTEWLRNCNGDLINYKGKLGVIGWNDGYTAIELHLWDAKKHESLKYTYTLPDNKIFHRGFHYDYSIVGVIATGEIVLSMKDTNKQSFCVLYFNPERNTLQHVKIQGLDGRVYAFADHAEDLNVNDAKLFKSRKMRKYRKTTSTTIR